MTQSRSKKNKKKLMHVVVVSDTHVGCQMALVPPGGALLDGGGRYHPSKFQKKLYQMWQHWWEKDVPAMVENEKWDLVINGDLIDGSHHQSTSQWSHNPADQARACVDLLQPLVEKCPGKLYIIRGTPCHVGENAFNEESIARNLDATPDAMGFFSRFELWKELGQGLIHFNHHISASGAAVGEATAPYKELIESFTEAGRWGDIPPDVVVRSHRHRHMCIEIATHRRKASSVVTPGWQGKTPFVHRIAGGRISQPQFGGVVLTWSESEKFIYERHRVWRLARPDSE